ncbi:hypothetical protein I7I51_08960, partial [Histoplasma capsulatum]
LRKEEQHVVFLAVKTSEAYSSDWKERQLSLDQPPANELCLAAAVPGLFHVTGLSTAYHLLQAPKGLPLSFKKVQRPAKISIDLGPDEHGGQSHATSNEYRRLKFFPKPLWHPAPEFRIG